MIHEDGSVTYIGGCSDSPERVAEVNAINKAKREKEASQRKASLERSQQAAERQRQIIERYYQKQMADGYYRSSNSGLTSLMGLLAAVKFSGRLGLKLRSSG